MPDTAGTTTVSPLSPFERYAAAGFLRDLLPIIPPNANLSPSSELPLANRGKVPGKKTPDGWVGLSKWAQHVATEDDLAPWVASGAGVGLNTRRLAAFDIDVLDEDLALALEKTVLDYANELFPPPPVRFGNAPKRLSLCRALTGMAKRRMAFRLPGDDPAEKPKHAVEFLSNGQQFVAEGVHPKTGKPYWWSNGVSPADVGFDDLVPLSVEDVNGLWAALGSVIDMYSGEFAVGEAGGHKGQRFSATGAALERVKIEKPKKVKAAKAEKPRKLVGFEAAMEKAGRSAGENTGEEEPEADDEDPAEPDADDLAYAERCRLAVAALRAIPNESLPRERWVGLAHAFKMEVGGDEEFYGVFEAWCLDNPTNGPEDARKLWDSISDSSVGAHALYSAAKEMAAAAGGSWAEDARAQFDATEEAPKASTTWRANGEAKYDGRPRTMDEVFSEYAYVVDLKVFVELATKSKLDAEQFSIRHANIGDFWKSESRAATQYLRNTSAREVVQTITYQPNQPQVCLEEGRPAVNMWRPSPLAPDMSATDADAQWWLNHVEYLIPDKAERETLLDWMAYVVQGNRPNWAVLVGGGQGIGKDLLFQPVVNALGDSNVNLVNPDAISGAYTDWAANAQMVIVQEMMNYDRGEMGNRIKAYITEPRVTVNEKFVKRYTVPNWAAYVFFTNHRNALRLERDDRRFFVLWSEVAPRSEEYYAILAAHIARGSAAISGWLKKRDVRKFAGKGKAPRTAAKVAMRKAGQNSLAQWVEDCIADGEAPFDTDVVVLADVAARCPKELTPRIGDLGQAIAGILRDVVGAVMPADAPGQVRLRGRLPSGVSKGRVWIVRRVEMLRTEGVAKLLEIYWSQRDAAVLDEFTA